MQARISVFDHVSIIYEYIPCCSLASSTMFYLIFCVLIRFRSISINPWTACVCACRVSGIITLFAHSNTYSHNKKCYTLFSLVFSYNQTRIFIFLTKVSFSNAFLCLLAHYNCPTERIFMVEACIASTRFVAYILTSVTSDSIGRYLLFNKPNIFL